MTMLIKIVIAIMKSYRKLNDFTPARGNEKLFVRSCVASTNTLGGLDNKDGKRSVEKRRKVVG